MKYLVTIEKCGHTLTEEVDAYSQDQARKLVKEMIEEDEDLEGYHVTSVTQ